MISCSNCGASFKEDAPRCPYCGQIYIPGAEKAYMDHLQDVKEDMSEVEEISEKIYHAEIKKNVKKIGVFIAVFSIIIILAIGFFVSIDKLFSYMEDEEDIKARILWERENFPILDGLYEEKNYEEILVFMEKAFEEKGFFCEQWNHYYFIQHYEDYKICLEVYEKWKRQNEITEYDATELLYRGMSILKFDGVNNKYMTESYSETEKEQLLQWKQEVEAIFEKEFNFSKDELIQLKTDMYKEGYLSYERCLENKKIILEKMKHEMY